MERMKRLAQSETGDAYLGLDSRGRVHVIVDGAVDQRFKPVTAEQARALLLAAVTKWFWKPLVDPEDLDTLLPIAEHAPDDAVGHKVEKAAPKRPPRLTPAELLRQQAEERAAYEARIGGALAQDVFAAYHNEIVEDIMAGREPDWAAYEAALKATLEPELAAVMAEQLEAIGHSVGIDWDHAVANERAVAWAREHGGLAVSQVSATTRKAIQEAVSTYLSTPGMKRQQLLDLLEPTFGEARASAIATTEVTQAYAEATNEQQAELAKYGLKMHRIWNTAGDELVCPICGPLDKKPESEWADEFPDGPPAHTNCILPGNVVAGPGLVGAFESHYVGRIIEVRTDAGRWLAVTENHPVLTLTGWKAAKLLREGDNVIVSTRPEGIAASIYPDYEHVPAAIEEIFGALVKAPGMRARRVPATAKDFHGDGRFLDSYINVVGPNRFLLNNIKAAMAQATSKLSLYGRSTEQAALVALSALAEFFEGGLPATSSIMGGSGEYSALFGTKPSHAQQVSLATVSGGNAVLEKLAADSATVNMQALRQGQLGFSGNIATDRISHVETRQYSGHVYDLQCYLAPLYTCNSIIVHNCRCAISLELDDEDA